MRWPVRRSSGPITENLQGRKRPTEARRSAAGHRESVAARRRWCHRVRRRNRRRAEACPRHCRVAARRNGPASDTASKRPDRAKSAKLAPAAAPTGGKPPDRDRFRAETPDRCPRAACRGAVQARRTPRTRRRRRAPRSARGDPASSRDASGRSVSRHVGGTRRSPVCPFRRQRERARHRARASQEREPDRPAGVCHSSVSPQLKVLSAAARATFISRFEPPTAPPPARSARPFGDRQGNAGRRCRIECHEFR